MKVPGWKSLFVTFCTVGAGVWAPAIAQTFTVSKPISILTTQQMKNFNVDYPDGSIGVVQNGTKYSIFGAGGSFNGIGPGPTLVPIGTYKFTGSLDSFHPAQHSGVYPKPSLELGRLQPSPDGSDFDRDYAGGGPTYSYTVGDVSLVQIYHGEFWRNYPDGNEFYACSGMAVSGDGGNTFTKIGEVLSPHITRQEFFASLNGTQSAGVTADAFMVEGDQFGNPTRSDGRNVYCYAMFTDRNSLDQLPGFAIARVKKEDFLHSIAMSKAPSFKKHYAAGGGFTEPGVGGSSTFVVTQGTDFLAWPGVHYCPALNKYLLIYQTNQNKIQVRTASNLFQWSQPITLIDNSNLVNLKTFYPAAIGLGSDPAQLGTQFYLYFQVRGTSFPSNPIYYRSTVTITN